MGADPLMAMRHPIPSDEPTHVGEGITRTTDPAAGLWPVTITFTTGSRPLLTTIRAVSAGQAEVFARNRHPNARSIVVGRKPND
jgi:hypothetical protein